MSIANTNIKLLLVLACIKSALVVFFGAVNGMISKECGVICAMNREYTDAHPNETCDTCGFFIMHKSRCTYKSNKYYCVRDEQYAQEKAKTNCNG